MFVWMEGHRTDEKGEGMEMMRFSFHSRSLYPIKEEEDLLPFLELYFSIHPKLGGRPVLFLSHLSSILVSFLSFQPNKERRGWASIFLCVS